MVEKEVVKTVEVPGETVVVEKEVVKTVEVPGPERVVVKEVAGKKYVTDPTTGKVVIAPEYGGTLTYATAGEPADADTHFLHSQARVTGATTEKLGIMDWAIDRDVFSFRTTYIPPDHPSLNRIWLRAGTPPTPSRSSSTSARGEMARQGTDERERVYC